MSRATQTRGAGPPDATGLALAQAVQAAVQPDTVILFGSRARGDHRLDSDVDLLVICHQGEGGVHSRARRAVRDYFEQHPPRLPVDVVTMTRENFDYCRRAKNHVAGQARRDGVIMNDESLNHAGNYPGNYADGYPDSWPDVKERLRTAYRQMNTFNRMMEDANFPQEDYGFHAQQAVENALKAWLSAAGLEYRRVHDLEEIAHALLNDPVEGITPAAGQLRSLLNYTELEEPDHPDQPGNWLTRYAANYRYSGTAFRMTGLDQNRFQAEINLAAHRFMNRAHELTGTSEADLHD